MEESCTYSDYTAASGQEVLRSSLYDLVAQGEDVSLKAARTICKGEEHKILQKNPVPIDVVEEAKLATSRAW